MGAIIRMDSEKFFEKFLPKVEDTTQYQFVLISADIKIKNRDKYKNIMSFPRLIPVPAVVSLYVNGDEQNYKEAYLNQLQIPQNEAFINVLVKAAAVNDLKVILICSKSESDKKYIEMLCEYIEATYKLNTFTWKKFFEKPEKNVVIKNHDEVVGIIGKKFERMEKDGVTLEPKMNKEDLKAKLEDFKRPEILKMARAKGMDLDEDISKKKLIKKFIKFLLQE